MPFWRAPEIILTHQRFAGDFESDSDSSSWASNPPSPTAPQLHQPQQHNVAGETGNNITVDSNFIHRRTEVVKDVIMAESNAELFIRPYENRDRHDVGEVCRLTPPNPLVNLPMLSNSSGGPEHIVPHIWCFPYLYLSPSTCFVLAKKTSENENKAIGFIIGTPDTHDFVRRCKEEYCAPGTETQAQYPFLSPDFKLPLLKPGASEEEAKDYDELKRWLQVLHNPDNMIEGFKAEMAREYPAHLHINILPPYQGQGYGRQLIMRFCEEMKERGLGGVHLGMHAQNWKALEFYGKLGFVQAEGQGTEEEILRKGERVLVRKL